jgi:hypothetical protein
MYTYLGVLNIENDLHEFLYFVYKKERKKEKENIGAIS